MHVSPGEVLVTYGWGSSPDWLDPCSEASDDKGQWLVLVIYAPPTVPVSSQSQGWGVASHTQRQDIAVLVGCHC